MKILVIRIKNLASLEGITEIDFTKEPLKSAGIFAITGPTGAGKSTILDALCLALYAKTPRYSQATENVNIADVEGATINQKDVRAILRDGAAEGAAEVDFVGTDGDHYRAGWYVRRAGGKPDGKLQGDTVKLENITTRTVLTGRKKETLEDIERLAGLSFEQFTRSVLLAQGDFTAFLKAGKDEKASLLEKLTGIRIYSEISMLVFEKAKLAAQELQMLTQEAGGIKVFTEEDIRGYKDQEQAYKLQSERTAQELSGLLKEAAWWEQLKILRADVDKTKQLWESARINKQQSASRELLLKQVEAVQTIRIWMENLRELKRQEKNTIAEAEIERQALKSLEEQNEKVLMAIEAAEQDWKEKEKQETAAIPLIQKARELDVLISERKGQIVQREQEVEAINSRYNLSSRQLTASKKEADKLAGLIAEITRWKEANRQREPVAENVSLIISKLTDAERYITDTRETGELIRKEEENLAAAGKEKILLEEQTGTFREEWEIVNGEWKKLQDGLLQYSPEDIEEALKNADSNLESTRQAADVWKDLYHAKEEFNLLEKEMADSHLQRHETTILLERSGHELVTAEVKKQTAESMVKDALVQAAENVTSLREQLIDGSPCPVCGSREHPFALHNPALDNVIKALEVKLANANEEYKDQLQKLSAIQQTEKELAGRIAGHQKILQQKKLQISTLEQKWQAFVPLLDEMPDEDEKKTGWLLQKLEGIRKEKLNLQQQLDEYRDLNKQAELRRQRITVLEKELDRIANRLKDASRSITSVTETIARLTREKEKALQQLAVVEETLSPYFSGKDWMQHWKTDTTVFVQKIKDFAQQWRTREERLTKAEKDNIIQQTNIVQLQVQVDSDRGMLEERNKELTTYRAGFDKLYAERKKIFDGESVQSVEERLAGATDAAAGILNEKKQQLDSLKTEQTKLSARLEQLQQLILMQGQQKTVYAKQVQDWLDQYNRQTGTDMEEARLESLLAYTHDWMEEERKLLNEINDWVTRSETAFQERNKILTNHEQKRLSDRPLEELILLKEAGEATLEKEREQLNEIRLRLRQDEENRKRVGKLQAQIIARQEVAENWEKLNELVGSADGKKFRQVAQEYTLDVLLAYANVHLANLSKRYFMQRIPGSLSLQVTDRDMGDEIRTIYSLSGGESFLVSLALALGLASLSSNEIRVESLFIDEGFGSLDPMTLAIVMDALDRLHNQGRKVGVISHVEEMTERIPAQIRVIKLTNGRSKVETAGSLPTFF